MAAGRRSPHELLVEAVRRRAPSYLGGGARDERVLDAMRAVDRADFLPPRERECAYLDLPLPIGEGQTCSEPSMVAFMLDELRVLPGCRVLEVGSGCGWAAAIAALLCSPGGMVYASEIVPALAAAGRANCAARGLLDRMEFIEGDGSAGFPGLAPFDRILLSAGAAGRGFRESVLAAQLADGGVLLWPEARGRMHRVTRAGAAFTRESWGGVAFVPLRGANS